MSAIRSARIQGKYKDKSSAVYGQPHSSLLLKNIEYENLMTALNGNWDGKSFVKSLTLQSK